MTEIISKAAAKKSASKAQDKNVDRMLKQLERNEIEAKARGGTTPTVKYYVGIDLGDQESEYHFLDAMGNRMAVGSVAMTTDALRAQFSSVPRSRIALEVGTHSPWVSQLLEDLGHEVYVANPRKLKKSARRNDRMDAEKLARQVRLDPEGLFPIRHRGVQARQDLVLIRARDALVRTRSLLVNTSRGLVKSLGGRLPKCSAESFHKIEEELIPEGIREALRPVVHQIKALTEAIREYDQQVTQMAQKKYPETRQVQQPTGVGDLTALAFVLTLENPGRFAKSRDVGPYLGLVPGLDESGERSPQLGISRTGDTMVRRLLVGSAHYILGPFGPDCDLRRFGEALAQRGGRNARKRAVVAVARKLGVLMHRLWVTGEVYEPLRQAKRNA